MSFIELVAQRHPPQAPAGMQPPENAKDWFRISNSADEPDTTDVFVYDAIGGWLGMWADEFIEQLDQITTKNIKLRLNSPGGSVFEGIAIANAIRQHPANVTVYVDSLAASIASVIAMAGDRLVMMPQSQIMIHNASGVCYGDATEMTKMADLLDKQSRNIAQAYAQHTGRPVAEWQQYMDAETWFTADEALAVGLADEVVPMKPKKETPAEDETVAAQMHRSWDLSMYAYAGRDKAPAPKIIQQVMPGQRITAGMANGISAIADTILPPTADDKVVVFHGYNSDLVRMVRAAVREELAVFDGAVGSHSTSVKDGTWDAGANEGRLPSPVPVATVRKMYGWYDSGAAEDGGIPKSGCKLPHHFVSSDGTPGAASINGVRNALARLPQTQGLSDAERKTVEAHLRAHLNAYGGDSEDHVHDDDLEAVTDEQPPADDSPPETIDASPPFPPKKEDEEEEEEEGDEPPPDEEDEPADEADDWNQVVGFLVSPATSPSADDVFAQLKEGW